MKAYELSFPGIHGSASADEELEILVREAGYSSTRSMLNDLGWWSLDVDNLKDILKGRFYRKD